MDSEVRETYRRAADDARDYANVDRVFAAARRRRHRRDALVALGVAVLLIGVGTTVRLAGSGGTGPPSVAASPSSPAPAAGARIVPPADLRPLPDGVVGPAKLLYRPCRQSCQTIVLLESGAQYALPDPPRNSALDTASLSPDGRLVGYRQQREYVVRRLDGAAKWRVAVEFDDTIEPTAWAPGSQGLLLQLAGQAEREWILLDFRASGTAAERRFADHPEREPVAVGGTMLPWWTVRNPSGSPVTQLLLEQRTWEGTISGTVAADLTAHLRPGESIAPGRGTPVIEYYNLGQSEQEIAVVVFDLARLHEPRSGAVAVLRVHVGGRVVARYDIPREDGNWWLLGPCDGEIAFAQEPPGGGAVRIVAATPAGQVPVMALPPQTQVRLPGALTEAGAPY